ncbi:hypothetical protein [Mucilaginibacter jinjuensis]|uniref:Uncharacterized protein n=1 Tax=Mucilaginibacter jinjuensis TaxID=1176721 RepID=A0ABY7T915_9SPHI|nr:hypothetical protein [Mucilaginibacter jinjuensis]WCT12233.1 hypothetical protein PQO05_26260 [Mucilaginibacter jinjuensis]
MKLKLLIISALLSLCISCKAQPGATVIKVLNGTAFKKNETVKYQLLSPQVVYYYVGLEQLLDNKWREVVLDISSDVPDRAAAVKKANASKPVLGTYVLAKIPLMFLKNGKVFRLKMNYGAAATATEKVVVSSEFRVN